MTGPMASRSSGISCSKEVKVSVYLVQAECNRNSNIESRTTDLAGDLMMDRFDGGATGGEAPVAVLRLVYDTAALRKPVKAASTRYSDARQGGDYDYTLRTLNI